MTNFDVLKGKRIALVSTVPYFMVFQLSEQIKYFRSKGMQVTLITSPGKELNGISSGNDLSVITLDISRRLNIWKDVKVLLKLMVIFHRNRYDIVHSTTPKAGLLSAIAGFLVRIPIRLHTFTGQPWVSMSGIMAWIARNADTVIGQLNTHCYADSKSQRDYLVAQFVASVDRISVVGAGSIAGVNLTRFNKSRFSQSDRQHLFKKLDLNIGCKVVLFVGRITRDKGIVELLEAFRRTVNAGVNVELILVGPLDQDCGGVVTISTADISGLSRVHHVGFTEHPEKYMAIADLLCVPSYREGFGTVVIEAAAMGVPTLGSKIYGLTDSIVDGVTGVLVSPRSVNELSGAMINLLKSPDMLHRLGEAARDRCQDKFDAEVINRQVAAEYVKYVTSS